MFLFAFRLRLGKKYRWINLCIRLVTKSTASISYLTSDNHFYWISLLSFAGRSQLGVCALQDKIYAVGGSDAWDCLNSVEVYDPLIDEWSDGVPMATCRRGAGVCVYKGRFAFVWEVTDLGDIKPCISSGYGVNPDAQFGDIWVFDNARKWTQTKCIHICLKTCATVSSALRLFMCAWSHTWIAIDPWQIPNIHNLTDLKIFSFSADFSIFCCSNLHTFFYFQPNLSYFTLISSRFSAFLSIFSVSGLIWALCQMGWKCSIRYANNCMQDRSSWALHSAFLESQRNLLDQWLATLSMHTKSGMGTIHGMQTGYET